MKALVITTTLLISAQLFAQSSLMFKPTGNPPAKKLYFKADGFQEKDTFEDFSVTNKYVLDRFQKDGLGIVETALSDFSGTTGNRAQKEGCGKDPADFGKSVREFTDVFGSTLSGINCSTAETFKKTKKLDKVMCKSMAECLHKNFNAFTPARRELMQKASQKAAVEAIALLASKPVNNMIEDEELIAYARAKFGESEIPAVCKGINASFITDKTEGKPLCKTTIVDQGFAKSMQICKVPSVGCFSDYEEFSKGKKTVEGETSILGEFIQMKSAQRAKVLADKDDKIMDELARIMIDQSISPAARAEKMMEYMKSKSVELDPVLASYLNDSQQLDLLNRPNTVKKSFEEYIQNNKDFNLDSIRSTWKELKKNEAKRLLTKSCSSGSKIKELCEVANKVMAGSVVVVKEDLFNNLLSKDDYSQSRKFSTQELIEEVTRCNVFQVNTSKNDTSEVLEKLSDGKNLFFKNAEGAFMYSMALADGANPGGFQSQVADIVRVSNDGKLTISDFSKSKEDVNAINKARDIGSDSVLTTRLSKNLPLDYDIKRPESVTMKSLSALGQSDKDGSSYTSVIKEAGSAVNGMASTLPVQDQIMSAIKPPVSMGGSPSSRGMDGSMMGDFGAQAEATKPKVQTNSEYQKLISKISGLEERLASASKKPVAETEIKSAPKAEEESELSRELRSAKAALADLKRSEASSAAVTRSSKRSSKSRSNLDVDSSDEESEETDAPGVISSGGRSQSAVAQASSQQASGRSSNNSSSSDSAGRSPSSIEDSKSLGRSSSGGSSGDNNSGDSSGLVLTRLDGISVTKANETISKMIFAESGNPFYIEEGGMVKQIIPELVDGKILKDEDGNPVYKTVVKGKVGEFKVDSKGAGKKKEIVAKAASPADVKMQDYQKVNAPAVRYRELQDMIKIKK